MFGEVQTRLVPLLLSALGVALAPRPASAVLFDNGEFLAPYEWLRAAGLEGSALARAFDATVLIGGRASGVIVSPDGLMMTARHTITDLYIGPTNDCAKIPLFLGHEIGPDGAADAGLRRLRCREILVLDNATDFALLRLDPPAAGAPYPFAEPERDPGAIRAGMTAILAGHPHASDFSASHKVISQGVIALYRPDDEELPHFLHLIDSEEGHSGAPVLTREGKLIGIHFRGVASYAAGVPVTLDGADQVLTRFNVALPVPFLLRKYAEFFLPNPR